MPPIPTPVPPVGYAGPVLLAALFSYFFMGILCGQFTHYIQNTGAADRWPIRTLATFVFVCQLTQIVLTSHKAWRIGVLGFIHPEYFVHYPNHRVGTPILNGLVAISVQGFFAWRIHKIKKDKPFMKRVPVIIGLLGLLNLSASIAMGIFFLRMPTDPTAFSKLGKIMPVHISASMAADMLITSCMFVILRGFKLRSPLPQSRSLLNTLIRNTVENGLIATTVAIVNLLLFVSCEADFTSAAFRWVIGFVDAIVLLTALNRREAYRGTSGVEDGAVSGVRFATIELTDLEPPANGAPCGPVNLHTHASKTSSLHSSVKEEPSSARPVVVSGTWTASDSEAHSLEKS